MACILLPAQVAPSAAQVRIVNEPVFRTYGMADGLSHGAIRSSVQSRSGFLWLGTQDGLNRFDGVSFRSYRHDPSDSLSLGDDFIEALAEAPDGRIWVGTNRGGLNLFDPSDGSVDRFPLWHLGPWASSATRTEDRMGRTIHGIVVTADGNLLLASDLGIIRFDVTSLEPWLLHATTSSGPVRWSLCRTSDGRPLAAVPGYAVAPRDAPAGAWSIAEVDAERLSTMVTFPNAVRELHCPGSDGEGFAVTIDGGVHAFDLSGNTRRLFSLLGSNNQPLAVEDLILGPDGRFWFATLEGLYVVEGPGSLPQRVGTAATRGLPDALVMTLLTDRTGVLWVGTWNGLAAIHPLSFTIGRVPSARGDSPGLYGSGVISIEPKSDGGLWLGASLGGVQSLSEEMASGGWTARRPSALVPLADARVMDLASERGGTLWIAALSRGVYRFDADGLLTSIPIHFANEAAVTTDVYSVFVDHRGDVWAGTRSRGLLRFSREDSAFHPFIASGGTWDFGTEWVWPMAEDRLGNLWIGLYSGGLYRIDSSRASRRSFVADEVGTGFDRILTLFLDSRDLVWVGTEGLGLSRLDPETGASRTYTTLDGLPHDNVQAIAEDANGRLWISTNDGIARFDVEREVFRSYREDVGLTGNRFFANSVHRSSDGRIYFGGERGMTILDPARMVPHAAPPEAALTSFRLNGREEPLARALSPGGLDLGPEENFFTFEFSGLDFRDPTESGYRYRLVGLDDGWIESGSGRVANYTSVPAGRYTFLVAVGNGDGVWNEEAISIPVRVRPPYYETLWFRASMLAALVGLVSAGWAYRLRELRQLQDLRLNIAGRIHDDIGANLSAIGLKAANLGKSAALDATLRDQLEKMGRLARESALKTREIVWVVNTRHDTLGGLTTQMQDTADTMLAGHAKVRFSVQGFTPDHPIGMELRQAIYLTFKESLQNIVKHADATNVDVVVELEGSRLRVDVRDDGKGCDWSRPSAGNGIGLMRTRLEKHGGGLVISGGVGRGTSVVMTVRFR